MDRAASNVVWWFDRWLTPHIKTPKTGADLLKDVPNRCSAHAKCQQTGPHWPVSLMVMVHVCCEWPVSPQCVPLPASLTGYIWTCFLTARKVKDENLGQRCSSPLQRYSNALRSLLRRSRWPCCPSTQQSWTPARSLFKIKLCNSRLLSGARLSRVNSWSGSAGVAQVDRRFPVESREMAIKQNALDSSLKDSGSRLLDLKAEHPKHLAEEMLLQTTDTFKLYI